MLGTTAENPTVGALVVDEPRQIVIGRGVTARGGRPHAEPQALAEAGLKARGRTLYVTLEPCNHWGKTPPCVDAVIRAGIRRVVDRGAAIPIRAPPARASRGCGSRAWMSWWRNTSASARLHEGFLTRIERGRPHVTAKMAVSVDGKIGQRGVARFPITGEVARRWTHMQRAMSDAVMVSSTTANVDKPKLTVRLDGSRGPQPPAGRAGRRRIRSIPASR